MTQHLIFLKLISELKDESILKSDIIFITKIFRILQI